MAVINSISVRDIVLYMVQGDYFANASVSFRKSDFTGPNVTVEVTTSIKTGLALADLHALVIQKARAHLTLIAEIPEDRLPKFVEEGMRGAEDYEYS